MNHDTQTITLHQDNLSFPDGKAFDWSEEHIAYLANQAIDNSDINLETPMTFRKYGVKQIVENAGYSKVAYIESNAGYFFISEDMMLHINVTYCRWD